MIVKKLSVARGGAFPGAGYNERKVAEGGAGLMLMENVSDSLRATVETLHRFGLDAGAEIERYLKRVFQDLRQYKNRPISVSRVGVR